MRSLSVSIVSMLLLVSVLMCCYDRAHAVLAAVKGDPAFVGLRGQQYQVHGIDGAVYNIISDTTMQLNSRFTFLTGPRACPVIPSTGLHSAACFAHDGSYLANLALRTNGDYRLLVEAGNATQGFSSVTLHGQQLYMGIRIPLLFADDIYHTFVQLTSTHELSITTPLFSIDIENSDGFINIINIQVRDWSALKLVSPHGLLGQTWQGRNRSEWAIEGVVDDYVIEDGDMYGTSFVFNRFQCSLAMQKHFYD